MKLPELFVEIGEILGGKYRDGLFVPVAAGKSRFSRIVPAPNSSFRGTSRTVRIKAGVVMLDSCTWGLQNDEMGTGGLLFFDGNIYGKHRLDCVFALLPQAAGGAEEPGACDR